MNDGKSLERSRERHIYSPLPVLLKLTSPEKSRELHIFPLLPVLSKLTSRVLSAKRKQLVQENELDNISEWKLQKYFRAVYKEQINETPSESIIQSQKEEYAHLLETIRKRSTSKCCSEP